MCRRCAEDVPKMCRRCAEDLPKIGRRSAEDLPKICRRSAESHSGVQMTPKSTLEYARGRVRGLRAPKIKAATLKLRNFTYPVHFVYLAHLSACSAFGAQRACLCTHRAARRPFRPWSATGSVVAAPQELVLLLGSIARQCGPIVSECTAPTRKMSPVNGGIGAGQQPSAL